MKLLFFVCLIQVRKGILQLRYTRESSDQPPNSTSESNARLSVLSEGNNLFCICCGVDVVVLQTVQQVRRCNTPANVQSNYRRIVSTVKTFTHFKSSSLMVIVNFDQCYFFVEYVQCDGKNVIVAKEACHADRYYAFYTLHVVGRIVICRLMSFVFP